MINQNAQHGFSLMEVMIALLVISVGALGYTQTQYMSLKNVVDANVRTTATLVIQDMLERMQANPAEVWQGLNSAYLGAYTITQPQCLGENTICTGAQMAAHDLADWFNHMINNPAVFPSNVGAEGAICFEALASSGSINFTGPLCNNLTSNTYPVVLSVKIRWKSQNSIGGLGNYDQGMVATLTPPLLRTPLFPPSKAPVS